MPASVGPRAEQRSGRPLYRSLRGKLALVLSAAALIPLVLVSAVGSRVVMGRLQRGLSQQTRQTAHIALNLLLRQVQRISRETYRLAEDPDLHELLALEPALINNHLERYRDTTESGLVEVALVNRVVVGRRTPRDPERFEKLYCRPDTPALARALDYERFLTLTEIDGQLVIQAAAPIVDAAFTLRGAVVMTSPLDGQMADYIKSVVRADIGFLSGMTPVASTHMDGSGLRLAGIAPPPGLGLRVLGGSTEESVQSIGGQEYAAAYAPLQTVQGDRIQRIGMISVALSRENLLRAQASAVRSMAYGSALCLVFTVIFAFFIGKRITDPLEHLHRSTQAIAAGDLEHELVVETDDEIGDLANAFQTMTRALQEHRERLAARVREMLTLHQIGRAVSSVLALDEVLRSVVTEVAEMLGAERGALLLASKEGSLQLRADVGLPRTDDVPQVPAAWVERAEEVLRRHAATEQGTLLAVPLETRERGVGALVMARRDTAGPFSEADLRLVVTFADQAASAIENARLYAEVSAFSAELEREVQKRTAELTSTNEELARAINELRDTQAMLIQQERMAVLGQLVAGVAHEINTPAGAIHGSAQTLGETIQRLMERLRRFVETGLPREEATRFFDQMEEVRRSLGQSGLIPPADLRRRSRELAAVLERHGIADARRLARCLVEAGAAGMADYVARLSSGISPELLVGIIEDLAFLERSTLSIQAAIRALVRLVRALKSYAHSDQEAIVDVDITDGLETTLTILHNLLRHGITVYRRYAELPRVPVYMDELNQVWTNLIHNAVQAMDGKGEIVIETFQKGEDLGVRIIDNGPGIPPDVLPRIFEPFFTTKPAGEGTGLGLGIAQRIVDKHGGHISVESQPGRTAFTVLIPMAGPTREERTESHDA